MTLFVGRQAELAALTEAVREGRCRIAVVGEAGVGKTTLIRHAVRDSESRPTVLEGGALRTLAWSPFLPLKRALGDRTDASVWSGDAEFVAAAVEAAVGSGLLVIDDVQWADGATRAVLDLLAGRIRLVVAVRSGEPSAAATLDRLRGHEFRRIDVAPLGRADALTVARHARPGIAEHEAETIVARSGGNPLLVEELAAGNVDSLKLAMAARLDALPPSVTADVELLALAGDAVPIPFVDDPAPLTASGLAHVDAGRIGIRHALLAEVIVDAMPDERRREVHRRLAQGSALAGVAARHYQLAGDGARAYASAMVAVEEATTPGERSEHLMTAAACASPTVGPDLMIRAAADAVQAGDFAGAGDLLQRAGSAAGSATATLLRARVFSETGDGENWLRVVDEALASDARPEGRGPDGRSPDGRSGASDGGRAMLLAEGARALLMAAGDVQGAVRQAEAAVAEADRSGSLDGYPHYVLGTALYYAGDPGWERHLGRGRELSRGQGDVVNEMRSANNLVVGHEGAGDPAAGRAIAEEMIGRAEELRLLRWQRHFSAAALNLAMHAGDYRAVVEGAPALLAGQLMGRTRDEVTSAYALALVNLGQIDEGLRVAERYLVGSGLCASNLIHLRGLVAWYAGDDAAALAEWPAFRDAAESAHRLALAAPLFVHAAHACGVADLDLPDLDEACALPLLRAVPRELAAIRAEDSDPGRAAADYAAAAELWAPYHRQGEVRCRWLSGVCLLRAGERERAVETLRAAGDLAQRHGMVPMSAMIERSLREAGVRRAVRRTPGVLSARESEILELVGRGLADAAIAARLGISVRTVQTHVAAARSKLGAGNRRQAAVLAAAGNSVGEEDSVLPADPTGSAVAADSVGSARR
ncbi:MAG: AAA family ATPase [Actinobacteria bacterium]|jgi:DNA-binding NarL/FixJ family response regulator|nr:AAA family ATPase [Actinomycetota bacterium]